MKHEPHDRHETPAAARTPRRTPVGDLNSEVRTTVVDELLADRHHEADRPGALLPPIQPLKRVGDGHGVRSSRALALLRSTMVLGNGISRHARTPRADRLVVAVARR